MFVIVKFMVICLHSEFLIPHNLIFLFLLIPKPLLQRSFESLDFY